MKIMCRYFQSLTILAILLSLGCGGGSSGGTPSQQGASEETSTLQDSLEGALIELLSLELSPYEYIPPENLGDGWQVGDLNSKGISPAPFEALINNIQDLVTGYLYIDSIAVAYNGELLLNYRLPISNISPNYQDTELHTLQSVTKSFTSALIGIAIDRGEIPGVDVLVHDYFQDKQPIANWSESKASITLENWLNMRSGYEWEELEVNATSPQMHSAIDPIQFLLDLPMATEPGTAFAYSTGISYGLGRIIQLASGMSVADYLNTYLLTPLNISQFDYSIFDDQLHTGGGLYLTTRDMMKLGQLYLDGGVWNGQRIISESWVNYSTQLRVQPYEEWGYGGQWWMTQYEVNGQTISTYCASGFGGQYIFVLPELDLVVGFTAHAFGEAGSSYQIDRDIAEIMQNDILPSFVN